MDEKNTTILYTLANGKSVDIRVSVVTQEALKKFERVLRSTERKERRYGVDFYPNDCMDGLTAVQERDLSDLLVEMDERDRLNQALVKLSPLQRKRVLLHFAEGLTYQQIAAAEKVHKATICRSIRKALRLLRELLRE